MFWTRVDIEDYTEAQSATGAVTPNWSTSMEDVEARVLPLVTDEKAQGWATPDEEAYEVHLRGSQPVRPRMRVLAAGTYYDVRQVIAPAPFGEPVTVLHVVRVTP